ncbi:MAG: hypothetical protein H7Z43_13055 [Clostridia bacterium]|nr:hypothetical protein [Deltaproteobacteria bacterium]
MTPVTARQELQPSECDLYIKKTSAVSLRVGETDGLVQAFQTFRPDAPDDAVGQLERDLDAARNEREAARVAGSSLGAPPTTCGPLSLDAIAHLDAIKRGGVMFGQILGAKDAFVRYAAMLGGSRETQVLFIGEANYPELTVVRERASYESLVKQISDEFGKQKFASR